MSKIGIEIEYFIVITVCYTPSSFLPKHCLGPLLTADSTGHVGYLLHWKHKLL